MGPVKENFISKKLNRLQSHVCMAYNWWWGEPAQFTDRVILGMGVYRMKNTMKMYLKWIRNAVYRKILEILVL